MTLNYPLPAITYCWEQGHTDADDAYETEVLTLLRDTYHSLCTYMIQYIPHGHYGDDCGDYRTAAADLMTWLHENFSSGLWHSEPEDDTITKLNAFFAHEKGSYLDGCICDSALDTDTPLDTLSQFTWETCPNRQGN